MRVTFKVIGPIPCEQGMEVIRRITVSQPSLSEAAKRCLTMAQECWPNEAMELLEVGRSFQLELVEVIDD